MVLEPVEGFFAAVLTKRSWSAKQSGEDRPWGGELRHLADFAVWESVDRNLVNRLAIELRSAARNGFSLGAVGGRRDE